MSYKGIRGTALERLMTMRRISETGCWEFTGALNAWGYGRLKNDPGQLPESILAHRLAWLRLRGPLPDDKPFMDHLCQNRACFNPDHLEPVTRAENNIRRYDVRTHCKVGHDLTEPGAIYIKPHDGYRRCRVCMYQHNRESAARAAERGARWAS